GRTGPPKHATRAYFSFPFAGSYLPPDKRERGGGCAMLWRPVRSEAANRPHRAAKACHPRILHFPFCRLLFREDRDMTAPQEQMSRMLTAYWVSQALYAAAKLKLADLLKDGPRTSDELAGATDTH